MIHVSSNQEINYSPNLIDKNINIVENRITSQLLEMFRKYEPRAILKTTEIKTADEFENDFEIELGIEVINIG